MLKEEKIYLIRATIKHVPRPQVIQALQETIELQALGGLTYSTKDSIEVKKKTAGGVFMTLIRKLACKAVLK